MYMAVPALQIFLASGTFDTFIEEIFIPCLLQRNRPRIQGGGLLRRQANPSASLALEQVSQVLGIRHSSVISNLASKSDIATVKLIIIACLWKNVVILGMGVAVDTKGMSAGVCI